MRSMAVMAYDEPLGIFDAPEPELRPGYSLLEVLTCGVCFSDLKTARGRMPFSDHLRLPHIPGHEIFGRVLASDPAGEVDEGMLATVFHYWPCGRCVACRRGDETLCETLDAWIGFTDDGGFRERLLVRNDRLIAIPPEIDPVDAAPLSCALGTAYRSVITKGGVRAGSRVAVIGLGGVGIHAAQMAQAAGATVVGFDVHRPTLEAARALGLDARPADHPDVEADVLETTAGRGVDVVVDTVGHDETGARAMRIVRSGGRIVCVGYAPTTAFHVATSRLVLGEVEVVGSRFAHRDDLAHAVALVAAGHVQPVVGMVRPLEGIEEVFAALESGGIVGRAVLDVAGVSTGLRG